MRVAATNTLVTADGQTVLGADGGPITINTTTTLRAAAFREDHLATNVDTQTYLFLEDVVDRHDHDAVIDTARRRQPYAGVVENVLDLVDVWQVVDA